MEQQHDVHNRHEHQSSAPVAHVCETAAWWIEQLNIAAQQTAPYTEALVLRRVDQAVEARMKQETEATVTAIGSKLTEGFGEVNVKLEDVMQDIRAFVESSCEKTAMQCASLVHQLRLEQQAQHASVSQQLWALQQILMHAMHHTPAFPPVKAGRPAGAPRHRAPMPPPPPPPAMAPDAGLPPPPPPKF